MRIAIVHYHLQLGGVMRIIEHTLQAVADRGVSLAVLTGEAPAMDWPKNYRVIPGLQYEAVRAPISSAELAREMEQQAGGRVVTLMASNYNLARISSVADILIGAVLRPGEKAPVLITREMVKKMKKGSIIIDLSIDQGGCVETSRPTSLEQPTFIEEGVIHYCVPNITSTVSRTSTKVLSNMVVPYLLQIGEVGLDKAFRADPALARGVYLHKGQVTKKRTAERFGLEHKQLFK